MRLNLCAFGIAAASLFSTHVQAQTTPVVDKPLRFFIGMGITGGGDRLATARYTNGTSVDINAGGLVQFNGGVDYKFTDTVSASLGIGYHVNRANGSNGAITFERYPIELLGHYAVTPAVRIGGGLRLIDSANLSSSGVASGINGDYGSSAGAVLEGEYLFSRQFGLKLRYVNEGYKRNGSSNKIDGSHAGLMFNFYF